MAAPVFEIAKDFLFSAAHQIRFHGGKCERLHGHNWRVRVHARASARQPARLSSRPCRPSASWRRRSRR
jgi:hypothetical protein